MPLRRRLLLLFLPLILLSVLAVWLLSQQLLLRRFDQLDAEHLSATAHQLHRLVHQQLAQTRALAWDWAHWDDTFSYLQTPNARFVESNLDDTTLVNLKLDFLLLFDLQGRLVLQKWRPLAVEQLVSLNPPRPTDIAQVNQQTLRFLQRHGYDRATPGTPAGTTLLQVQDGLPLVLSSSPVTASEGSGPSNGTLVLGFYLTHEVLRAQREQLLATFEPQLPTLEDTAHRLLEVQGAGLSSHAWLTPRRLDGGLQHSELVLLDDQQRPTLQFALQHPRPLYRQGQQVIRLFFLGLLGVLVLGGGLAYAALEVWVLRRIQRMQREVTRIGPDARQVRLSDPGQDELGQLAGAVNGMLERVIQSEARDRAILHSIQDGFFEIDTHGNLLAINPALEEMLGYPPGQLLGRSYRDLLPVEDLKRAWDLIRQTGQDGVRNSLTTSLRRQDGRPLFIETRFSPIQTSGQFAGVRGIVRDVSTQVAYQNRLLDMAYRDALTGLGNRKAFSEQLQVCLEQASASAPLALLYIDLDRFKEVNDRFGHALGDALLKALGERLRTTLRQPDLFYRVGGDEFTMLLPGTPANGAQRLAERLLACMAPPFVLNGENVDFVTLSIGIALYPEHAGDAQALVKAADSAMYLAKQTRNGLRLHPDAPLPPSA
ncbi:MAG: diguanylate cyclase [Pseudomonas sp.]|uniref:sensor domain-containing diguanylate cyclase n=1 Tax=Pseudomonas sp. TaxID=306 RepID=UPI00339949C4